MWANCSDFESFLYTVDLISKKVSLLNMNCVQQQENQCTKIKVPKFLIVDEILKNRMIRIRLIFQTFIHGNDSKGLFNCLFFGNSVALYLPLQSHTKCSQINGQSAKQTLSLRLFLKSCFRRHEGGTQPRSNQRMIIWWPKTIISSLV